MNESIENANINSEIKAKRFNLKSLILIINYFITPILIMVIFFLLMKNMKFVETVMNLPFVYNFFQNNKDLIENETMFKDFLISVIGSVATLITFIIGFLLSRKRNDSISTKNSETTLIKLLLIGIGIGIIMILWNIVISYVYPLLGLNFESENTKNIFESLKFNKILIVNMLISAPIGEEIVFKYGIFTFLHEIFQNKGKLLKIFLPAFVSAFIFAIIHDGLYLVPLYIVPSFIGCLIYEKTKSLMPCILGHFINNIVALLAMLYS